MNRIRRGFLAFALGGLAMILAGAPAQASGNPDRQPFPAVPDMYLPFCAATAGPVFLHTDVDKEYIKTFTKSDGTVVQRVNGRLVATFSANGKSVTVNNSGPTTITFYPDGSITIFGRGLNGVGNSTGLWVTSGRIDVNPADGSLLRHDGHSVDICALLMP
jgi:hypothetical protein